MINMPQNIDVNVKALMIINLLIPIVNVLLDARWTVIIINRVKHQLVEISINCASECILARQQSRSRLSVASDDCAFRRIINHLTIVPIKQPKWRFLRGSELVISELLISELTSKVTYARLTKINAYIMTSSNEIANILFIKKCKRLKINIVWIFIII